MKAIVKAQWKLLRFSKVIKAGIHVQAFKDCIILNKNWI